MERDLRQIKSIGEQLPTRLRAYRCLSVQLQMIKRRNCVEIDKKRWRQMTTRGFSMETTCSGEKVGKGSR